MFRRKDTDPGRGGGPGDSGSETPARPSLDGPSRASGQPELPRRRVEIPTAPSAPAPEPAPAATSPRASADESQGKRLIVGKGIRLSGEITACDRLIVEGFVEVTLNETRAVEIAESGRFIGGCEVEEAEISGVYEGELTVRNRLTIHATGRVEGTVRYGELEIERGGRMSGNISMLSTETPSRGAVGGTAGAATREGSSEGGGTG